MKNLLIIISLFITSFVNAQTKLDSLVLVKVNEYRTDVYDIGYDDGLTQAVETIKEYFGVELWKRQLK